MQEHIYTIPVNEAFESCGGNCPFCMLFEDLEETELDLILGASMMEPDIRKKTNEKGFCGKHYRRMFTMKNRLGMALTLESHLETLKKDLAPGGFLAKDASAKPIKNIAELEESCYVCERIEEKFAKMIATAVYLYHTEEEFRNKFNSATVICLPHYRRLLTCASSNLPKKVYANLFEDADKLVRGYLDTLKDDVSWFCRKFDYRFDDQPWGNSKDSVERSIRFLTGGTTENFNGTKRVKK